MSKTEDRFKKTEIKENLLRYCESDTWAMVRIWQGLKKEVGYE